VIFGVKNEGFGRTPTLATVGLNGFGNFTGFETSRFLWVLVIGVTFRRLSPGTAALSGIHSPSRTASHSWNLGRFSFMEVFTAAGNKKATVCRDSGRRWLCSSPIEDQSWRVWYNFQ